MGPRLPRTLRVGLLVCVLLALLAALDVGRAAHARRQETWRAAKTVAERLRADFRREYATRFGELRSLALVLAREASVREPYTALLAEHWPALSTAFYCIELRDSADRVRSRAGDCAVPVLTGSEPVLVVPVRGEVREAGVVRAVLRPEALLSRYTEDARVGAAGYALLYDRARRRVLLARHSPPEDEGDVALEVLATEAATPAGTMRHLRYGRGGARVSAALLPLENPPWSVLAAGYLRERGTLWSRLWLPRALLLALPAAVLALLLTWLFRRRLAAAAAQARVQGRRAGAVEAALSWLSDGQAAGAAARELSHELRNPLGSLRLDLETLADARDARARRAAGAGLQELERLDSVLRNALALAREPGSGSRAPVRAALQRAAEALGGELAHAGVRVLLPPPGADVWVPVAPADLQRLFINVFRNAQQAMSAGGDIAVTMERARHLLRLRVSDAGDGIPPEQRRRVFEPLFTTRPDGSGLGLPAVRGIAERAGGRVAFVDQERGACLELVLPVLERGEEDP